ncbi:MAG: hypothetical protein K6T85_12625 [Gorillibacterium sp.]|nr:hypothetical protein [Gorillibacterium sp.]
MKLNKESMKGSNVTYYRSTSGGRQLLNEKRKEWHLFNNTVDLMLGEGNV